MILGSLDRLRFAGLIGHVDGNLAVNLLHVPRQVSAKSKGRITEYADMAVAR